MRLIETTALVTADFPISALKDQLRLGTGFSDSGAQDALLETCLRAALGAIEARIHKILLRRRFQWNLNMWRLDGNAQAFPVSQVSFVLYVRMVEPDGNFTSLDSSTYTLMQDDQRPKLVALKQPFPSPPEGGSAEVSFYAGFGTWNAVPADLQRAMLMLAASYYENREGLINGGTQMPFGVAALLEPYKRVRLGAAP